MPSPLGIVASAVVPASGGAWTPASLPGVAGWYDSSDLATITATAGKVSQWNDKSGNARHAVQATGTAQSGTGFRTVNGWNVLDFDGTDDKLVPSLGTISQPFTIYTVSVPDVAGTPVQRRLTEGQGTSAIVAVSAGDGWRMYSGNYAQTNRMPSAGTTVSTVAVFNGATSTFYENGVQYGGTMNAGTTALAGGGQFNIGGESLLFWDGAIAELVVQSGAASPADRAAWDAYVQAKWMAFTPAALPNLKGWWDASDAASITASAGSVSQWNDKSSAARHFTQGTGSNQPTTAVRVAPSGRNVLAVASDYMDSTMPAGSFTNESLFVVYLVDDLPANPGVFTGTAGNVRAFDHNTSTARYLIAGAVYLAGWNTPVAANQAVARGAMYSFTAPGSTVSLWRNDVTDGGGSHPTASMTGTTNSRVGTFNGYVAEVVAVDGIVGTSDRAALQTYFNQKWLWPGGVQPAGWYDASDASTITSSAGAVSQLADKSGNGRHLVNGTGVEQPATGVNTQNGRNVLTFNGTKNLFTFSPALTGTPTSRSVFMVMKPTSIAAYRVAMAGTADGSFTLDYIPTGGGTRLELSRGGLTSIALAPSEQGLVHAVVSADYVQGVRGSMWTNGVANGETLGAGVVALTGVGNMAIGKQPAGTNFIGEIAEVIVYDPVLTTTQRQAVETYLRNKWFDPSMLPGLAGWYDASDAATITSSAGKVSQWADKSGNARHLVQASSAEQPRIGTLFINGRNVIDGATSGGIPRMNADGFGPVGGNVGTFWGVLYSTTQNNTERFMSLGISAAGNDYSTPSAIAGIARATTTTDVGMYYNGAARSSGTMSYSVPHVVVNVRNADSSSTWIDGVAGTTVTGLGTSAFAIGSMRTGHNVGDGGVNSGTRWAEIGWNAAALTTTERQALETYLKAKWGTP